jgi:hypothetical protein
MIKKPGPARSTLFAELYLITAGFDNRISAGIRCVGLVDLGVTLFGPVRKIRYICTNTY